MATLTVVIMTNGVVQSTYGDGTPADMFSGKLPILKNIFFNIKNKDLLSREQKINYVKFYISNDPLHINILEVTGSYLEHILKYIRVDKLEEIPINQQQDVDVNELIKQSNKLSENTNFDNEKVSTSFVTIDHSKMVSMNDEERETLTGDSSVKNIIKIDNKYGLNKQDNTLL